MTNKNPFIKKRRASEDMSIQITSMADIFTIILVFLLKSYSTSSVNIQLTPGMKLPVSTGTQDQVEAIKIEISEKSVQIENQPIAQLENFRFNSKDIQANGSSSSLNSSLEVHKKKQLLIAQSNSEVKADQKLLVIADQRTPYTTLKSVLASAAVNGYTDFKFIVARKD